MKPGTTGRITLSVKIYPGWAGHKFNKKALVNTNDPKLSRFVLALTGQVEGTPQETSDPKPETAN